MADQNRDKEEKIKEEENEQESRPDTRQREFLEERFSVIKPKTQVDAGIAKEFKLSDSSPLKENFHQEMVKSYRECQKHHMGKANHKESEDTGNEPSTKKNRNDLDNE